MADNCGIDHVSKVRMIPSSYVNAESQSSALGLILTLCPDWEHTQGNVEFVQFTDGITNTLLKAIKRRPGYTEEQLDEEAILLRAYGSGSEVLIDRNRECASHFLLSQHGLAPPLLARFENGLLYRFVRGRVCTSQDLTREHIWRGVARRLAEWHARLPVTVGREAKRLKPGGDNLPSPPPAESSPCFDDVKTCIPEQNGPNLWTVLQKWIRALPNQTEVERNRRSILARELERTYAALGHRPGFGRDGLVFGHCDLLSGNVIIQPEPLDESSVSTVSFIDYEYATPCPAAYDIANHFAEWSGFACDYSLLPTRSQRRAFIHEYLTTFIQYSSPPTPPPPPPPTAAPTPTPPPIDPADPSSSSSSDSEQTNQSAPSPTPSPLFSSPLSLPASEIQLSNEIDLFRGIPGLYWGIWALIQAGISTIDFDYQNYAQLRLGEYWAWRAEQEREDERGEDIPVRERRWAEE